MARARNIKPGFFLNEELADLPFQDRLLFIGLWTLADFQGCMAFKPRRIKALVMPFDDCDVEQSVVRLIKSGFVRIYSVEGQLFLKIDNFRKHQRPHKNEIESGSDIPDESQGVPVNLPKQIHLPESPNKSVFVPIQSEPLALNTSSLILNTFKEKDISIDISKKNDPPKKRKTRIPDTFAITEEMATWAAEKTPTVDISLETENFIDHYRNKGDTGLDWIAKWRTWMRNAYTDFGKYPNGRPTANGHDRPTNGNGKPKDIPPEKDMLSPDYVMEPARLSFFEVADSFLNHPRYDGTREAYEKTKADWLKGRSAKGFEYEIEQYERTDKFRQRFGEARQVAA